MLSLNPNDLDLLDAEHIGADSVEDDIAAGGRSVDVLTDLEFGRRHPERGGAKIQKGETALAAEWAQIRDSVVRPALARAAGAPGTALVVRATPEAVVNRHQKRPATWTFWRVLGYGLGGLGALLLGAWAFRHRGHLGLEARVVTRHAGQLAGRARASFSALGGEHRALRQSVAEERQGAQAARRARKLQVELMEAGRRVNEATRIAEQKARQLQALQTLQTLRGEA